ncbi:hybrid sensor histidine kinase/response regulator transcription factor [Spirosoma agri]|uniref:histidine kinase n=1 Tax=Spirosoma agri TaxID=1987381 RepID=A0A6M0IFA8_9BACT|nr:hybrid sensor histidine kinase/response regulator transcription factor [Spirosoma agri]NEU66940.1 response regulator [Spirosoma agri]
MVRPSLLLFLLIPLCEGLAQPFRSDRLPVAKSHDQPIDNRFDHLSVKDGLSNNSVNCILQDREGFIWFGTNDGLNKYDGYTFTVLQPDLNNPARSFQNNQISGLCEDHENRLWAVTEGGGLHEVNKHTGRVTPHPIQATDAGRWNYQHSIYEDSQHALWLSTLGGLARYEPNRHLYTLFPLPQPAATIKTVFEDPQHRLWVGTLRGLYLLDQSTGRFTLVPVAGVDDQKQPTIISFYLDAGQILWLGTATAGFSLLKLDLTKQPRQLMPYNPDGQLNPFVYLNSIHRDKRGFIWIGTTNGLQCVDPVSNRVFTYHPDPNTPKGISSNNAQTVYHDRAGTVWIGTDNGIDRQAATVKPFVTYQVRPNMGTVNLPENKVTALLMDASNQLWLSNGYTVYRQEAGSTKPIVIPPETLGATGQHKNATHTFLSNGAAGIWLGTIKGIYYFDLASKQYTAYPSKIPAQFLSWSPTGDLWLGGDGGIGSFSPQTHRYVYYHYKPGDTASLPDQYVHGLMVSRTGDVWVLLRRQGLCRLNPRTGIFTRYKAGPKGQLNSNDVQTIYEDRNGIIWIGTHQGGLNRFDYRTGLFSSITTLDGLPSNSIVGIAGDRHGHLWLSTNKGLCRFDPEKNSIRSYELTNGLPSNDFLQNAITWHKNRLYFGSLNGVVHFNPDSIRDDTRPFPVYITTLTVMDQPQPIADPVITLRHDENFLSFGFAALTYAQPDRNQYSYQLVGVDKNWVPNGNHHFAKYTNLSPGDYTFRVKAANSDGIWNEKGASIHLIIQPPWWATWWAYAFYTLLAGYAIWRYIRFYTDRIRQQQAMELNRREAEQLKMVDELKTRFFSNITHEFRTPLSLIISPVEKLLLDSRFDTPTRQTLSLVQRNADQLLRLINQLLDLSKLEANHMTISPMRGDVVAYVSHLVDSFRHTADQKGVTLTYTADRLEHEYLFDADKWAKILTNLLSNALKFTGESGSVQLVLAADSAYPTGELSAINIRITDSGIGISADNLPHIFDRFYQVDNSHTRAYEGTGIGLALVKELVDLVGGTITVDSQSGVGTTFRLKLPVQSVSVNVSAPSLILPNKAMVPTDPFIPSQPESSDSELTAEQQAPLILIVEDNAELRGFLAGELAATYRVLCAVDGEEGWKVAQHELPDIVISDVMMPRMDGYELTHRIKNHTGTDHIAVVILTAKAAHSSRIEGLTEGADDYLAKPFHLNELHLRVRNLIARQQRLRDQYRQPFSLPDTPSPITTVDDAFLHRVYELLENHLSDPLLTIDWLADQVAMSRKTFYRKIHGLLHLSPHELIRQYRLRKAADLLRAGYSASQTAYLTGFKTPSYFTMVFKEFYQKTPTEFVATGLSEA